MVYNSSPKWCKESYTGFNRNYGAAIIAKFERAWLRVKLVNLQIASGQPAPFLKQEHISIFDLSPAGAFTRQGRFRAAYSSRSLFSLCTAGRTKLDNHRTCQALADRSISKLWWCLASTDCHSSLKSLSIHQISWAHSKCPRLEEPHPATIRCTLSAVAIAPGTGFSRVVLNSSGVTAGFILWIKK